MSKGNEKNFDTYHCPVEAALDIIGGKWKVLIIWQLKGGKMRFSTLEGMLPMITPGMLTKQLRELERDGIVSREIFAEVPLRVEYSLTNLGVTLSPVLDSLCTWGQQYMYSHGYEWKGRCKSEKI
ncbi:MAG TPA: helix-turn-helix domain-containing protein [Methanospirillum sp.]|nr:helix-turn-helix domain-containing protein [Methanospirillum sp.]